MRNNRSGGFTLIEIIIAVAILGIVVAFAIPSYSSYVTRSKRVDAHIALREAAQIMERCRTENFTYVGCDTAAGAITASPDNYYSLAYSNVTATTFTVTASPNTSKSQANDTDCQRMTIDQTGFTDSRATSTSTTSTANICW